MLGRERLVVAGRHPGPRLLAQSCALEPVDQPADATIRLKRTLKHADDRALLPIALSRKAAENLSDDAAHVAPCVRADPRPDALAGQAERAILHHVRGNA